MRKMYGRFAWFVVAVAFLATSMEARAENKFTKVLMKKADKNYAKRANKGRAEKARETYEKVLAVAPDNVEARWKLARVLYWLGSHAGSKDAKMKQFEQGIRYAQEAVQKDKDCVACYFWLGVSYGKYGEAKGILQSLGLVPHIKEAMEKVVKMNERYAYGGAHRVLGRMYNRLPAMKGGDNDKAVKHLKKAIEIGPNDLMNHRFLAEVQLDMGNKDEAKQTLKHIIEFPKNKFYKDRYPESSEEQDVAKKLWLKHWEKFW